MRGYSRATLHWMYFCVIIVFGFACAWVVFSLQTPPKQAMPLEIVRDYQEVSLQPAQGFEAFNFEQQEFGIIFPAHQSPIVAEPLSNPLIQSRYATRDFVLSLYDSRTPTYLPFDDQDTVCTYDGALRQYTGESCVLTQTEVSGATMHAGLFVRGSLRRYVVLAPVKFRAFIFVTTVDYQDDCGTKIAVCDARALQAKTNLDTFMSRVIEKNHNLFAQ